MTQRNPTIKSYKENEETIWIPVAKGKSGGAARAFLPFNGLRGNYTFGFKAAPIRGEYFEALRQIQQAYVDNESKLFLVNDGKKKERQSKARWRHGNKEGAPLLGPTLGWIQIPVADLEKISDALLGEALRESGNGFAILVQRDIPPVLCESLEELERESSRLFRELSDKKPVGQAKPNKIRSSVDQFVRDAAVVAYVLSEANGSCECCMNPAPFVKRNGLPYLEVHHVLPLSSGGSDKISNAIAVCPNCHRELHHGTKSLNLVEKLYARIARLAREQTGAQQSAQPDSLPLTS